MITVTQLGRRFGDRWALQHLSFSLGPGEFLGILGRNGAGKTTLVRLLTGQLKATEGSAHILGLDVGDRPLALRHAVGVMPEEGALLEDLSGKQYIHLVGCIHGLPPAVIETRRRELEERLQVDFATAGAISGYSYGTKKKLALCAALLHGPRLLFLDEPFEGLDPAIVQTVLDLLRHLHAGGLTIVLTSHLLSLAERLCTRLLLIEEGRLALDGTPEALLRPGEDLEGMFMRCVGGGRARGGLSWI